MSVLFAETSVEITNAELIVDKFQQHFAEHFPVIREGTVLHYETEYGKVWMAGEKGRFQAEVNCYDAHVLMSIKAMLAEHLLEFSGDKDLRFRWQGHGADLNQLPNLFEGRVVRAFNVTPRMRRLVISVGEGIERLMTGGLHIRILIVPQGRTPVWPHLSQTGAVVWPEGDDELIRRVYTIRYGNVQRQEIELDFVMHEGDHMPGAHFGATAKAGDLVGIIGPGGGVVPVEVDACVFAGDETALPVISRMVEELPAGKKITVYAEVADENERQDIKSSADVNWTWLYRNGKAAGTSGLLEQALRQHDWSKDSDSRHVFIACEKGEVRQIKKFLSDEAKLPKNDFRTAGYWVLGEGDDH